MADNMDLLIVGAGPAGLGAAISAQACGLDVAVADEYAAIGGQIFRNIHLPCIEHVLDKRTLEIGRTLVENFEKSGVRFHPNTTIWGMEGSEIFCKSLTEVKKISASKVLFATGGYERPVPFKGWTLPGVYTAGAAEMLFRSAGELPTRKSPVVLCGNGPLLMALAVHLIEHGVPISAWLDTGKFSSKLSALAYLGRIFHDMPYFKHGMRLALEILKAKVPIITGVTNIEAHGGEFVEKVVFTKNGKTHELAASTLIRHEGVIPRIQIPDSLGMDLAWDTVQRYWYPKTDGFGRTSLNNVYITGDNSFVHGGEAAIWKGYVCGYAIAEDLGIVPDSEVKEKSQEYVRKMELLCRVREYLRHVFAPNPEIFNVSDDTIVCRCECVTAGEVRQAVKEGFTNPREVKIATRAGMGTCQGRSCGVALAEIIAQETGNKAEQVGILKNRQPFEPVFLADYCALHA